MSDTPTIMGSRMKRYERRHRTLTFRPDHAQTIGALIGGYADGSVLAALRRKKPNPKHSTSSPQRARDWNERNPQARRE
jgi:hypothetical protein